MSEYGSKLHGQVEEVEMREGVSSAEGSYPDRK